jgi:hypothetical protein
MVSSIQRSIRSFSLQRYLVIDYIASMRYSASGWRTTHEEAEDVTSRSARR